MNNGKIDWSVHGDLIVSLYESGLSVRGVAEKIRITTGVVYHSGTLVNFLGRRGVLRTQSSAHAIVRKHRKKQCAHCFCEFFPTSYNQRWCDVCTGFGKYSRRMRSHGLCAIQLEKLLAIQCNKCGICGKVFVDGLTRNRKKTLYIDHDHDTGNVRGLLCPRCNMGLSFIDSQGWIDNALDYLERSKTVLADIGVTDT